MKKLVFCALLAAAVMPATVSAVALPQMEMAICQSKTYEVLRQAAEQLGENYDCLCNAYENGEVTVVKEGDVYRVQRSGGVAIIVLEDSI